MANSPFGEVSQTLSLLCLRTKRLGLFFPVGMRALILKRHIAFDNNECRTV